MNNLFIHYPKWLCKRSNIFAYYYGKLAPNTNAEFPAIASIEGKDLVLIHLKEPVIDQIPIKILEMGELYDSLIQPNKLARVLGWSDYLTSRILRMANVYIEEINITKTIDVSQNPNKLVIDGDSGGPLVVNIGQEWFLAGIISSIDRLNPNSFNVTDVARHKDWIDGIITTYDLEILENTIQIVRVSNNSTAIKAKIRNNGDKASTAGELAFYTPNETLNNVIGSYLVKIAIPSLQPNEEKEIILEVPLGVDTHYDQLMGLLRIIYDNQGFDKIDISSNLPIVDYNTDIDYSYIEFSGLTINPVNNQIHFIIKGTEALNSSEKIDYKAEVERLIKMFKQALVIPNNKQNISLNILNIDNCAGQAVVPYPFQYTDLADIMLKADVALKYDMFARSELANYMNTWMNELKDGPNAEEIWFSGFPEAGPRWVMLVIIAPYYVMAKQTNNQIFIDNIELRVQINGWAVSPIIDEDVYNWFGLSLEARNNDVKNALLDFESIIERDAINYANEVLFPKICANTDSAYRNMRSAHSAIVLAQWYKTQVANNSNLPFANLVNSENLNNFGRSSFDQNYWDDQACNVLDRRIITSCYDTNTCITSDYTIKGGIIFSGSNPSITGILTTEQETVLEKTVKELQVIQSENKYYFSSGIVMPEDKDGDGYTENQGDCNDFNKTIYPGALEICGDGIDQDCNGSDLVCVTEFYPYTGKNLFYFPVGNVYNEIITFSENNQILANKKVKVDYQIEGSSNWTLLSSNSDNWYTDNEGKIYFKAFWDIPITVKFRFTCNEREFFLTRIWQDNGNSSKIDFFSLTSGDIFYFIPGSTYNELTNITKNGSPLANAPVIVEYQIAVSSEWQLLSNNWVTDNNGQIRFNFSQNSTSTVLFRLTCEGQQYFLTRIWQYSNNIPVIIIPQKGRAAFYFNPGDLYREVITFYKNGICLISSPAIVEYQVNGYEYKLLSNNWYTNNVGQIDFNFVWNSSNTILFRITCGGQVFFLPRIWQNNDYNVEIDFQPKTGKNTVYFTTGTVYKEVVTFTKNGQLATNASAKVEYQIQGSNEWKLLSNNWFTNDNGQIDFVAMWYSPVTVQFRLTCKGKEFFLTRIWQ